MYILCEFLNHCTVKKTTTTNTMQTNSSLTTPGIVKINAKLPHYISKHFTRAV